MKTLKKTLCLLLALVMVLGTLAISASAAEFTDAEDVEYDEAVGVLNFIGVITGYEDGSFRPDGELTRAEAAAIICRVLLTDEVAKGLSATTTEFNDVPDWAAPYVAYLTSEGVVIGYGDGRYGSNDKLTGHAFAKMLNIVLGDESDYENTSWTVTAEKNAKAYGLNAGLPKTFKFADNITREQACVMALNALQYSENASGWVVKDAQGNVLASFDSVLEAYAAKNIVGEGATVALADGASDSLLASVFGVAKAASTDETGAIGVRYTKGRDSIFFEAESVSELPRDAKVTKLIFDGEDMIIDADDDRIEDLDEEVDVAKLIAKNKALVNAAGATVKYFKTGDKAYTAVVTAVYAKKLAAADIKAAEGQKKAYIVLESANEFEDSPDYDLTYETEAFKKDDVVLYTIGKKDDKLVVLSVELADLVAEEVKVSKKTGTTSFVAGGKTYKYSYDLDAADVKVGSTYDLYADKAGNIILAEPAGEEAPAAKETTILLKVTSVTTETAATSVWEGSTAGNLYYAMILENDKPVTIQIDKATYDLYKAVGTKEQNLEIYNVDKIVEKADTKDENVFALTEIEGIKKVENKTITTGKPAFIADGAINAKTVFVVKTVTQVEGKDVVTYKTVKGFAAIDSIQAVNGWAIAKDGYATLVYITSAEAIVAPAEQPKYTAFVAVKSLTEEVTELVNDKAVTYATVNVVIENEIQTVKVPKGELLTALQAVDAAKHPVIAFTSITVKDGFVTAKGTEKTDPDDFTVATSISYADDVLSVGDAKLAVASGAKLWNVDKDGKVKAITLADLKDYTKDIIVGYTTTGSGDAYEVVVVNVK